MSEPDYLIKICLTGDSKTGKTNYLRRLTLNDFNPDSKSTIGVEFATKTVEVKEKTIKTQIWDTAGQERYRAITNAYYRGATGVFIFYDVSNLQSYNNLQKWLDEIREHNEPNMVIMIIANKCDIPEEQRKVSTKRGKHFAKQNNLLFYEVSARYSTNIQESFMKLVRKVYNKLTKKDTKDNEKDNKTEKIPQNADENNSSKSILLSSAGLKNIIQNNVEYFTFNFGPVQMKMDKIFAQFLSPLISRILLSDPTVDSLNFEYLTKSNFPKFDELFNDEVFDLLHKISRGELIEIDEIQTQKLMIISILLYNQELFDRLSNLYPIEFDVNNIEGFVQQSLVLEQMKKFFKEDEFDISETFDEIAKKFSSIDKNKILSLPKSILLTLISNKNLQVESEDDLFDLIIEFFGQNVDKEENEEDFDALMTFLEKIELKNLSEGKCYEYLQKIDPNQISGSMWQNICSRFNNENNESKMKKK